MGKEDSLIKLNGEEEKVNLAFALLNQMQMNTALQFAVLNRNLNCFDFEKHIDKKFDKINLENLRNDAKKTYQLFFRLIEND